MISMKMTKIAMIALCVLSASAWAATPASDPTSKVESKPVIHIDFKDSVLETYQIKEESGVENTVYLFCLRNRVYMRVNDDMSTIKPVMRSLQGVIRGGRNAGVPDSQESCGLKDASSW
jgi:hypothetical protein